MQTPMNESTMASAVDDLAAIERWEDEGGRALVREKPVRPRLGDLPGSERDDGTSPVVPSRAGSARQRRM
jgi:hypothetical protein